MTEEQFNKISSYVNQPKPWYEVMRTWLPTILLIIGAIYSVIGPWQSIDNKLAAIEQDVRVIQWVMREIHGTDNEDIKEWIPNPFGHGYTWTVQPIEKPYERFNCIVDNGVLKFD